MIEFLALDFAGAMFYEEQIVASRKWYLLEEFELGRKSTWTLCGLVCHSKNCQAFRINSERNSCEFGTIDPLWDVNPSTGDSAEEKIIVFFNTAQRGS